MKRLRANPLSVAVLTISLGVAGWATWHHFRFVFWHDTIQELQGIPIGNVVHLAGEVTAVDPDGKRFWLQDDTGAVAIKEPAGNPAVNSGESITPGESVAIEATKAASYDAFLGPGSVDLENVKVSFTGRRVSLPRPPYVVPADLPSDVVHRADRRR